MGKSSRDARQGSAVVSSSSVCAPRRRDVPESLPPSIDNFWRAVPDETLIQAMERGVGLDHADIAERATLRCIPSAGSDVRVPLHQADPVMIDGGLMVRTIPKYRGRRNYSGWAWVATGARTVPYESLLERSRVLIADFDPAVVGITSQGLELTGFNAQAEVRRFPDLFLMRRDAPPLVVDVTSRSRLHAEKRVAAFTWTAAAVRGTGWDYEVWCGADPVAMANLELLAGYRRPWVINGDVMADIEAAGQCGELWEIEEALAGAHRRIDVIPAVRHAIWMGIYQCDLSERLDLDTRLTFVGSAS